MRLSDDEARAIEIVELLLYGSAVKQIQFNRGEMSA
jgi:hypothetical protein